MVVPRVAEDVLHFVLSETEHTVAASFVATLATPIYLRKHRIPRKEGEGPRDAPFICCPPGQTKVAWHI